MLCLPCEYTWYVIVGLTSHCLYFCLRSESTHRVRPTGLNSDKLSPCDDRLYRIASSRSDRPTFEVPKQDTTIIPSQCQKSNLGRRVFARSRRNLRVGALRGSNKRQGFETACYHTLVLQPGTPDIFLSTRYHTHTVSGVTLVKMCA